MKQRHLHILVFHDIGVKIVLSCESPNFDWNAWVAKCLRDEDAPEEMRMLSLLLAASGMGPPTRPI